jgi:recombination protein RecA
MSKTFDAEKQKNLDVTLQQIDKQYGKGSIMRLGDSGPIQKLDVISTGSLSLDAALGVGGVPRGRVIEIYGPESSGKTTLALTIIAEAQKKNGKAAIIDAEHALDPNYARALGVDIDDLLVSQPDTGEQALDIAEMLIRSGALDVVVIDSVAALVPKAEIEGEMGDSLPGLQARLMSQAMRKLTAVISRSRTSLIFINQLRMKIGVMFGNPETTTGGNALKFYSTIRMEIRRMTSLKDGDTIIGNHTKVKVVKNKVAPPFREAEFDIIYGQGIERVGDMLDLAANLEIVSKSGTWYTFREERLGQGRERVIGVLKESPAILTEIEKQVRKELGFGGEETTPEPTEDGAKPKSKKSA